MTLVRGLRPLGLLAVVAAIAAYAMQEREPGVEHEPGVVSAPRANDGTDRIVRAVAAKESGFVVEVAGRVARELSDDNDGSRHQRFILALSNGHTLLVAHNIDLAPRVPLTQGAEVRARGQYEWNPRGGVLHWTHHDPQRRREGGWIRVGGKDYQ